MTAGPVNPASALPWRAVTLAGWDALAWLLALATGVILRFEGDVGSVPWLPMGEILVLTVLLQTGIGYLAYRYCGRHLIGVMDDAIHVSAVTSLVGVMLFAIGMLGGQSVKE